ncbi:hypothetical protein FMEAI12_3560008 [Parafrankia sp. Ea1.12]|nr:hypothetical protein FMEAI12_3560008 [Parafrankia sp. Ea1.12]
MAQSKKSGRTRPVPNRVSVSARIAGGAVFVIVGPSDSVNESPVTSTRSGSAGVGVRSAPAASPSRLRSLTWPVPVPVLALASGSASAAAAASSESSALPTVGSGCPKAFVSSRSGWLSRSAEVTSSNGRATPSTRSRVVPGGIPSPACTIAAERRTASRARQATTNSSARRADTAGVAGSAGVAGFARGEGGGAVGGAAGAVGALGDLASGVIGRVRGANTPGCAGAPGAAGRHPGGEPARLAPMPRARRAASWPPPRLSSSMCSGGYLK